MKTSLDSGKLALACALCAWAPAASVLHAQTTIAPGTSITLGGTQTAGSTIYDVLGGITNFQDDGSASGALFRSDGGTLGFAGSATAASATITTEGGPGNGGRPGVVNFRAQSTAGGATINNAPGVTGPNFKNEPLNPTTGLGGETRFFDDARAGTAHINNAAAAFGSGFDNAITSFEGNASADHAVCVNHGVSAVTSQFAYGGETEFSGNSTAGSARFTNLNSNNGTPYSQGRTVFYETANAGGAIFTSKGADGGFVELGGSTEFRHSSSAASGTFINEGPTGGSFPLRGLTQFFDNATAGGGLFQNLPGAGGGGGTEFYGHSTADNATFINDSTVTPAGMSGGEITFKEDSSAANGYFSCVGLGGGLITFHDRSTADHGTFTLSPDNYGERVIFWGSSTAANGTFDIGGSGLIQFFESSSAGHAAITLRGNGTAGGNPVTGGSIGEFSSGTAGNATIVVMGAEKPGAIGGSLYFQSPATAGNATIIVNGSTATTFGAYGGSVSFDYGSHAGNATLIANGGTNGGAGGAISFGRGATGDQARVIVNAGGTLNAAGNVFSGGTEVGSVEGAGKIALGASLLTAGVLNTDTTVSGAIVDDSNPPFYIANGALTKVGTGSLTLSGANTYTGVTTVNAGTLIVNGSLAGAVQVNAGATLKCNGTIAGGVTVAPGGIVAPGNSPGTLTIGGDFAQAPQGVLEMEVAGPNPESRDLLIVHGGASLGGTLLLVFSGYAPSVNESLPLLEVAGKFTDNHFQIVVLGLKPGFQPGYQFADGKLTLTATSSGQLTGTSDPLQVLQPSFASQSGFVFPVFTLAGAIYQFDTSTDLKSWIPISQVPGANALIEFRHLPPAGEPHRFYRVVQTE